MSEIKVNKISPRAACGTVQLGDSGDTFTIPAGATINNQGTATNFGATGSASWNTTVKTSTFTAVAGEGYFVNTTGGAVTVNLPAGVAGAVVAIKDYAGTFDTNKVTVSPNGSDKIGGDNTTDGVLSIEGLAVTFVFVDSTQGWLVTDSGLQSEMPTAQFITATGGTVLTCGNFKTHVFTGPGTFTVCSTGNSAGSNSVDYLVVAGGGSAGWTDYGSAGGAGGFRLSNSLSLPAPTTSPLATPTAVPVTAQGYPIVVGAGATNPGSPGQMSQGSTSSALGISSAGGGYGHATSQVAGGNGGSGGGGIGGPSPTSGYPGGAGNTPPVTPPQGNPGGAGYDSLSTNSQGGGGGGAGAAATNSGPGSSSPGGVGSYIADAFMGPQAPSYGTPGPVGSTRFFAGGGGGAADTPSSTTYPGGAGGGGTGGNPSTPAANRSGSTNTGGGAGAGSNPAKNSNGGSGIVLIRYKFQ